MLMHNNSASKTIKYLKAYCASFLQLKINYIENITRVILCHLLVATRWSNLFVLVRVNSNRSI